MSQIAARVWNQQIVAYCPHTSVSGDTWQLVKRGTCTSSGASDGTTLIDTGADSGGADTYNGTHWVKCTNGANQGLWKRVTDDDGSGTLTFEGNGFPVTVASSVEYEIWLSPDPVVVVETSSGETDMVDATRSEAAVNSAGFWVGYYAIPITGARRGKIAKITAHTAGTGTFVLAAGLGGALTAGDVVVLRKLIETSDLSLGPTEEYIRRAQNRTDFAVGDGVVGARAGSVGFSTQIVASGALSIPDAVAGTSPAHGLMEACGLEQVVGKSMTAGAGCSVTSIKIATGTWEYIVQVGMAIQWSGNVSFVTAITDGAGGVDTLTVSPPLPVAPAESDPIYAARMYKKSIDGDVLGCVIETEHDGIRYTHTGCVGNVSVTDAAVPMFAFEMQADHWIREIEAAPYAPGTAYTTTAPVLASDRIAYLGTTKVDVKGFTATAGTTFSPKMVQGSCGINGRAGFHLTGYNAGGTWREIIVSGTDVLGRDAPFSVRTSYALAVIYGGHSKCVAVRIPVARLIESPTPADGDGLAEHASVFEAQDAGYANDGTPTAQKTPDFAIHIF